MLLVYRNSN